MPLSPFLMREAADCPCRETHGASVVNTPPVRLGLLDSANSNTLAVKSPVLLTSRDFALAEAWCFCNSIDYGSGKDRDWQRPGVGREWGPLSSKTLSRDKRCTCFATEQPRMGDSGLFECSSVIVTIYLSLSGTISKTPILLSCSCAHHSLNLTAFSITSALSSYLHIF